MKINSLFPRLAVVSALVVSGAVVASGQSYYDDDIYYDASKAPKTEVKKVQTIQNQQYKHRHLYPTVLRWRTICALE